MNPIIKKLADYNWEEYGLNRDMSINDYESLFNLLQLLKSPLNILEIGTRQGSSAALFASYIEKYGGNFYTCDNYVINSMGNKVSSSYIKLVFNKHILNLELSQYITFINKSSAEVSQMFENNFFDLVFIDGCHIYRYVKEDIELWYPKVKTNGILCGHDCEFIPENDFIIETLKNNSRENDLQWDTCDMLLFHLGIIIAVYERFKHEAKIMGNRIWYVKKT